MEKFLEKKYSLMKTDLELMRIFQKMTKRTKVFILLSVTFGSGVKNSETFVGILQKEIKEKIFLMLVLEVT